MKNVEASWMGAIRMTPQPTTRSGSEDLPNMFTIQRMPWSTNMPSDSTELTTIKKKITFTKYVMATHWPFMADYIRGEHKISKKQKLHNNQRVTFRMLAHCFIGVGFERICVYDVGRALSSVCPHIVSPYTGAVNYIKFFSFFACRTFKSQLCRTNKTILFATIK